MLLLLPVVVVVVMVVVVLVLLLLLSVVVVAMLVLLLRPLEGVAMGHPLLLLDSPPVAVATVVVATALSCDDRCYFLRFPRLLDPPLQLAPSDAEERLPQVAGRQSSWRRWFARSSGVERRRTADSRVAAPVGEEAMATSPAAAVMEVRKTPPGWVCRMLPRLPRC